MKVFFKLEYQDYELLKSVGIIGSDDYDKINKLGKGQLNMYLNNAYDEKLVNEITTKIDERLDNED